MASGDLIPRIYSSFRGVDLRGGEIHLTRSPDALNVWRDYKDIEGIKTRPDIELFQTRDNAVFGLFFYEVGNTVRRIVHSGTKLYDGDKEIYSGMSPRKSNFFVDNNILYILDGLNYLEYDGETCQEVVGYIPTTTIGKKPKGEAGSGGSKYEDVNLLTGLRKNSFEADGKSLVYALDAQNIDTDFTLIVMVNDERKTDFTVDYTRGEITFDTAPAESYTVGQDNMTITYRRTVAGYRDRIDKCTMLAVFDNRVFFSGNKDYPNAVFHSSLNNPRYVSDLDYYNEGMDLSPVRSMIAGNNALWVLKEPSQANTTVFYHNPVIDSELGKVYPSTHSSIATGCIGAGVNFNDDIVFFSDRGMEAISGDVTTEQVLAHRSSLVDSKLLNEPDYKNMILEEYEGYLLVIIGKRIYLADSRAMYANQTHNEYEWFVWELDKAVTCTRVYNGVLYLGTADGVYTLTDNESAVESWWSTPIDKFNHPSMLKTTNKRGCVVEATGDLDIYAKTDKTEWQLISQHKNITDYLTSRIKMKKFKDVQLKFYSTSRFSLETATLEAFVGGYIKR